MQRRLFLRMGTVAAAGLGLNLGLGLWAFVPEAQAVRGPSPDESARARRIFEQLERNQSRPRKGVPTSGSVVLSPGEILSFEHRSYCLDHQFAAPSSNEPLAFRPMNKYIAPQLRQLYTKLMRRVAGGEPDNVDVQKIVWAMRTPASGSWSEGLSRRETDFLNTLMPGGAALLQSAYRPADYLSGSGGSRDRGGSGRGGRAGGALLPQLAAQLPFNPLGHSNDLMRQLLGQQARIPMPGQQSRYSMLNASGVAGRGIGAGGLAIKAWVANGSGQPFSLDFTQWVLESPRDVQAVALPPPPLRIALVGGTLMSQAQQNRAGAQQGQGEGPGETGNEGNNGRTAPADGYDEMQKEFTNHPAR